MTPVDLGVLIRTIPLVCQEDTTQSVWNPERPVTGHCVLASLLTQQHMGGKIARGLMSNDVTHYWNVLPSGAWLDTTRSQFDNDIYPTYVLVDPPKEIYLFADTYQKYDIFLERFWTKYYQIRSQPNINW